MSLWDNTPMTLTSFTPLSSEVQPSGSFLTRWFRKGKDDSDQSSEAGSQSSSREVSVERGQAREQSLPPKEPLSLPREQSFEESQRTDSCSSLSREEIEDSDSSLASSKSDNKERLPEGANRVHRDAPKRTLRSVIASLSNILDRRTSTPQVYRDSDFRQYWMPDRSCPECYDCGDKFTTFRRRHHCRICGQIFCNACCNQELPGKIIGFKGSIRVCIYCCQVVQKYAQKADPLADPKVTKEALDKAYQETDGVTSPEGGLKGARRSTLDLQGQSGARSPGDQELGPTQDSTAPFDLTPQFEFVTLNNFTLERRMLIQDSAQLRSLWRLMLDPELGVDVQSYRIRLRTYQKCIVGNKLVDWLLKQDKVATRAQAQAIGQALIDADYLEPIGNFTTPFRDDFTLYKPTEISLTDSMVTAPELTEDISDEDSAPQWFQDIVSNVDDNESISEEQAIRAMFDSGSVSVELGTSQKSQPADKTAVQQELDEPLPQQNAMGTGPMFSNEVPSSDRSSTTTDVGSWRMLDRLSDDNLEKLSFTRLQRAHHDHLTLLTKQLLSEEMLPAGWADIIISTIDRVSLFVRPDIKNNGDDMDIRHYVHIKKVPGGSREQTALVHGVIFTKNVAHKNMAQTVSCARTLLLNGSIEYQRVENKMSSLQPQILQEEEFLRKSIAKILALKPRPNIVIVEKSVSRLAQDFLLKHDITLIYNVKLSVMTRLARFLQADIVPSIDSLVGGPNLGFCHSFSVRSFPLPGGDQKTMLCFDGCATHLGCAITLRGGSMSELKRVKKLMSFLIYASYHSRLETSFCMDEFLLPPPPADDIPLDWDLSPDSPDQATKRAEANILQWGVSEEDDAFVEDDGDSGSDKDTKPSDSQENREALIGGNKNEGVGTKGTDIVSDIEPETSLSGRQAGDRTACFVLMNSETEQHSEDSSQVVNEANGQSGTVEDTSKVDTERSKTGAVPAVSMNDSLTSTDSDQGSGDMEEVYHEMSGVSAIDSASQNGASTTTVCNIDQSEPVIRTDQSESVLQDGKDQPEVVLRKSGDRDSKPSNRDSSDSVKDPLQKTDRGLLRRNSEITQLTDHSDPLHNYQKSQDDSIFHSTLALQEQRQTSSHKLRKALESVAMSISPYIQYELPYLETEKGLKCELRKYFPEEIYWSSHFGPRGRTKYNELEAAKKPMIQSNIEVLDAHELIRCKLNKLVQDRSTQKLLAQFRAYGGRINVLERCRQISGVTKHLDQSSKQKENHSSSRRQSQSDGRKPKENSLSDPGMQFERKPDCLDPFKHQRLAVLFSSYSYASANHPSPCVFPWVVTMEFYGRNDVTLGGFLERFCFRQSYVCPSDFCDTPMVEHIRKFAHGSGSISVVLKQLDSPITNGQTNILVWSWCHKCKQVTPVVPISSDTWNMSFAKFLEIRFHGTHFRRRASAEPCDHSLHHDHFQYFGYKDIVASFKYSPIKLKEIKLPPFVITSVAMVEQIHLYRLRDEAKRLANKVIDLYSIALDCVLKIKADTPCDTVAKMVSSSVAQQQAEKSKMRDLAHEVKQKLDMLLSREDVKLIHLTEEQNAVYLDGQDKLVQLKRDIAEAISAWNNKLQELYVQQRKYKQTTNQKKDKEKDAITIPVPSSQDKESDDKSSVSTFASPSHLLDTETPGTSPPTVGDKDMDKTDNVAVPVAMAESRLQRETIVSESSSPLRSNMSTTSLDSYTYGVTPGISAAGVWPPSFEQRDLPEDSSYVVCHRGGVVSLDEAADNDTGRETPPVTIETDKELQSVVLDPTDIESKDPVDSASLKPSGVTVPDRSDTPDTVKKDDTVDSQAGDKMASIKKTLMNTLRQSPGAYQLLTPFDPSEHHQLPAPDRVPIVVYDHEPSSIIAYSLSCQDYINKLHEVQSSFSTQKEVTAQSMPVKSVKTEPDSSAPGTGKDEETSDTVKKPIAGKLSFFKGAKENQRRADLLDSVRYVPKVDGEPIESPTGNDELDGFSIFSTNPTDANDKSKAAKHSTNLHIELQFSDSTARFYCKAYFAEQFRQLRKLIFPAGEEEYIRALSRCKYWEAKGGKSGSTFCKTDDDRFILKQMSSMEVESFEKFGPQYFHYISRTYADQRPTALAKIVGVYRIGFRNQCTNNAMKQDVLVVENLFYNRKISQTFDLKGSMRNRLVSTNPRKRDEELVLLDENLLRASVDCPLYIRPHSKTMLTLAINHDSQFLASHLVMDYSLLVGLDEQKRELVVGIIDYIRTFTWDKKLETVFKTAMGGQGKMPTVVSPEVYRTRFLDAMGKYFLPVPDQWSGLGRDVDN